jgi:Lsr2
MESGRGIKEIRSLFLDRATRSLGETMQRIEVALEDDLTGGPADETVQFGFDGTAYELDLNSRHAADMRHRLAPFVEHARRVRYRVSRVPVRTAASRERSRLIRAWAERQGLEVSDRGRLSADVIQQYENARDRQPPVPKGRRSSSAGRPKE